MTADHDFIAEQAAIEDALDADRDPFAGEDPPADYLAEESERHAQQHRDDAHGGGECDCPEADVPVSDRAPF